MCVYSIGEGVHHNPRPLFVVSSFRMSIEPPVVVVLYGPPESGKTRLANLLAPDGPDVYTKHTFLEYKSEQTIRLDPFEHTRISCAEFCSMVHSSFCRTVTYSLEKGRQTFSIPGPKRFVLTHYKHWREWWVDADPQQLNWLGRRIWTEFDEESIKKYLDDPELSTEEEWRLFRAASWLMNSPATLADMIRGTARDSMIECSECKEMCRKNTEMYESDEGKWYCPVRYTYNPRDIGRYTSWYCEREHD